MELYLLLVIGALAAGFVNGLAGFGSALFALGFFLAVMPPLQAVAVIVALSIFAGILGMFTVYQHIPPNKKAIIRLTIPGLLGVPMGIWALVYLSADHLRILVAALLLVYGGYFSTRAELPRLKGRFVVIDALVGFIGGFLGGLAALSGALPTMWYAARDREKQDTRTILQCYNLTLLTLAGILLAIKGAYTAETLYLSAIAVAVALVAAKIGLWVFKRLSSAQFQRLLITMCLISGLIMFYRIIA